MAYTRNTRIKVTEYLNKTNYCAQVEYKHPITRSLKWIDIGAAPHSNYPVLEMMFCERTYGSLPWQADRDCLNNKELDEIKGIDWAKAQIDEYHKLFDEQEFTPTVEYIKYP